MGELTVSLLTILTAFAIHLAVWKIRLPKRQTRTILLIFFGLLTAILLGLSSLASALPQLGISSPPPFASYLHIAGFVISFTLAYMITYSAVEVDSPSLVMTLAIHRAGCRGLPEAEFQAMMNDALLIEPRIRDMLRDKMVRREGEVYYLTPKGARMARLFIFHRALLNVGKGG